MGKRKIGERVRYWFDNVMTRGTSALIGMLGLATIALVIIITGLVWVFRAFPDDAGDANFIDILWGSLLRTLDPGTMGGDVGWGFRVLMLVTTIGGLVIIASLISIVSGAFHAKIEALRKGRSRVLEREHTLILGWNSRIDSIIKELAIANQFRRRARIVVLAQRDKVEMDDHVRELGELGGTKVICRTGDPKNATDLVLVSPDDARSMIVLTPEDSAYPDAEAIKVVLALIHNPQRGRNDYSIVAELRDSANLDLARMVGGNEVTWLSSPDLIARIAVQTCRQSGMSAIYSELLSFEGNEIYFTSQPSLVGRNFGAVQAAFPKCVAIGLVRADERIELNPDSDTTICAGDQVIVIAEDDHAIALGEAQAPDTDCLIDVPHLEESVEHVLVLGVNPDMGLILEQLDDFVAPNSMVHIIADDDVPELPPLTNLRVSVEHADQTRRAVLESLDLSRYGHILVLADFDATGRQEADSRTLVTLLHLRDLCAKSGIGANIVSEMLDDANRRLAEVTQADDFIVSDRLVALLLAQLSENAHLSEIYDELLTSVGCEIYLKLATNYLQLGREVDFYTVLEAARRHGETAIGYRVAAQAYSSADGYGIRLNPRKSDPITFSPGDRIIVLAASKD